MAKRFRFKAEKIMLIAVLFISSSLAAQEESKFEITPSVDVVSSYVWRGMYQTGPSVQPGLTLAYGGLSLGVWGSTDFSTADNLYIPKEFDITLGYETGGFSIGVTDYWWSGETAPYGHYKASHFFEGTVGYSFGESFPFSLSWSTMLGLDGDKDADGDQLYSTYVSAAYDFSVKDVAVSASLGISPWTGSYHKAGTNGLAVSAISLKASKELKISDSFSLPVFVETIIAPNQDNVFLVFGISL